MALRYAGLPGASCQECTGQTSARGDVVSGFPWMPAFVPFGTGPARRFRCTNPGKVPTPGDRPRGEGFARLARTRPASEPWVSGPLTFGDMDSREVQAVTDQATAGWACPK